MNFFPLEMLKEMGYSHIKLCWFFSFQNGILFKSTFFTKKKESQNSIFC